MDRTVDQYFFSTFFRSGAEVAGVGRGAVVDVAAALSHLGGGIESAAVRVLRGEATLSCPHVGSPLGLLLCPYHNGCCSTYNYKPTI